MPSNSAEYMRDWRQTPNGQAALDAQKKRARAKAAAVKDLIAKHQVEFETLFADRLQEEIDF